MKPNHGITPNTILQVNPEECRDQKFAGCLLVVTAVRRWGVEGFVQEVGKECCKPGPQTYYRATWNELELPVDNMPVWVPRELTLRYYKLEGETVVPCDAEEGLSLMDAPSRVIARSKLDHGVITTVFLTIDQAAAGEDPVLFETLATDANGALVGRWTSGTYEGAMREHGAALRLYQDGWPNLAELADAESAWQRMGPQ